MRRYLTYTFPPGNTSDVCKAQNTMGAGNLILNGNLVNSTGSEVNFLSHGYSRSISLSSGDDLSNNRFTVTGTQNGVALAISNITGPNANTVYINNIFDVVTSVSVNGAVNDIKIGTGFLGYFPLQYINLQRAIINYSLSLYKLTAVTIPTKIVNTLDNIGQNGILFSTTAAGSSVFEVKASAASDQYLLPIANVIPCHSLLVIIEGTSGTIANSIRMNFIQT